MDGWMDRWTENDESKRGQGWPAVMTRPMSGIARSCQVWAMHTLGAHRPTGP
jgi:hypothetical protein